MFCVINGHDLINELQTMTQVFYPNERFIRTDVVSAEGITAVSEVTPGGRCRSHIYHGGALAAAHEAPLDTSDTSYCVKKSMFLCLVKAAGYTPDWGMLTGIRPSKLVHAYRESGLGDDEIVKALADRFFVKPEKVRLCLRVADAEETVFAHARGGYSVYIGIPFCPSRCLYCSFPSQSNIGLAGDYLTALEKELAAVRYGISGDDAPDAVYIGGGTPTVLSAAGLDRLLTMVGRAFPLSGEFTVEAGRPDTIDREKLRLLKAHGVTRLSINPQTMNDKTLAAIGRGHTREQFLDAFALARDEGHYNINVDLILGLPGEGLGDVQDTLVRVLAVKPESLTAHTLAVKRASRLKEQLPAHGLTRDGVEDMLAAVERATAAAGLLPYYMYRQKNMLGNFENVGYCLPGYAGVYNVMIMTERQSILALGAGAVTKTVDPRTGLIERVFNVKNVEAYIARIDEMIDRKKGVVVWET